MDPETGEILAEKGTVLIVVYLIDLFPHLEKELVLKLKVLYGGVLEEDVILQSIKIYAPNDEDEKVINVLVMRMLKMK